MTDPQALKALAAECQAAGRALGARQNKTSVVALSPAEISELSVLLRTSRGPVELKETEKQVLIDLLKIAGDAAVMLPATAVKVAGDKDALSVTALTNTLLSAGNVLELIAKDLTPVENSL